MSRRRYISTDISTDPKVADLAQFGPLPLLLYTWSIPHMDDWGRMTGEARQFKLLVCPALDVTAQEIDTAIDQVASAGLWSRYQVDGRVYLAVPEESWFKHQTYINKAKRENDSASRIPSPQNAEEHRKTPKNTVSPSPSPSPTPSPSKDSGVVIGETEVRIKSHFEQTYSRLPNHIQVSRLSHYMDKGMELELVLMAITKAREKGKDITYAHGILDKQYDRGIRTVAQAEMNEAQRQAAVSIKLSQTRTSHHVKPETQVANADERYANFFKKYPGGADGGPRNDTG